jgi:hypothetical protein
MVGSIETGSSLRYRGDVVLDHWAGKLIDTPRDVVRLHHAVKLGWVFCQMDVTFSISFGFR